MLNLPLPIMIDPNANVECPSFNEDVFADYNRIIENPIGQRLLKKFEKINDGSRYILIQYSKEGFFSKPLNELDASNPAKGSSSVIFYSDCELKPHISFKCKPLAVPRHVQFFHLLLNAYFYARGKVPTSNECDQIVWSTDHVYQIIIGFPSKNLNRMLPKITENAFRVEEGLEPRFSHHSYNSFESHPFMFSHLSRVAQKYFNNNIPLEEIRQRGVVNLTLEDFPTIGGTLLFCRVRLLNSLAAKTLLEYHDRTNTDNPKLLTSLNLRPNDLMIKEHLKSIPNLRKIESVGLYLLTEDEANNIKTSLISYAESQPD